MLKKTLAVATMFTMFAMTTPAMVFANGSGRGGNDDQNNDDHGKDRGRVEQSTNEFGVKILDDNRNGDKRSEDRSGEDRNGKDGKEFHNGMFSNLFYSGEVTAVSSTGFTILTNSGVSLEVNAASAKIVRIPRSVIALGDIAVGDKVHITGTKADGVVTAIVIYDMPANLSPAVAKGTVTVVTDDSITVQTKNDQTITVNTNGDTQVVDKNGDETTLAAVDAGAKVKLFGLWDSILNVFNAIKIRLK